MEKLKFFKKLLTLVSLAVGLGTSTNVNAQNPVPKCDASFTYSDFYIKTNPPQYGTTYFEAVQKGHDAYQWDFGDGSLRDTGLTVYHQFPAPGRYYVTLGVSSLAGENNPEPCKTFKGEWILIGEQVLPDAERCNAKLSHTVDKNRVKVTDEVVFMPLIYDGITVNRTWDWGDGKVEPGTENATHIYATPGTYTVTLTKTAFKDPCFPNDPLCKAMPVPVCERKYAVTVVIHETEIPKCPSYIIHEAKGLNVTFYENLVVDYFDNSYYDVYEWNFGDGTTGTGIPATHTYSAPGNYAVTVKKTTWRNPCMPNKDGIACMAMPYIVCSGEQILYLNVTDPSKCEATIHYQAQGLKVVFEEGIIMRDAMRSWDNPFIPEINDRIKYIWSFGDGDSARTNPVVKNYKTAGKYKVHLTKIESNQYYYHPNTGTEFPMDYRGILPGGCYVQTRPCTSYAVVEIEVFDQAPVCKADFDLVQDGNFVKVVSKSTGHILTSKLEYGDGDVIETNGSSVTGTHRYAKEGNYEVCLSITSLRDPNIPFDMNFCTNRYCHLVTVGFNTLTDLPKEEAVRTNVTTYPVPAQDKVKFFITNGTGNMDLRIYNATGILAKEVKGVGSNDFELEIPELENGLYLYSFSNAGGVLYKGKIVVKK